MMRSTESASSVFYHSQEEEPCKTSIDGQSSYREAPSNTVYDCCQDPETENSPITTDQDPTGRRKLFNHTIFFKLFLTQHTSLGLDGKMSPRRRAYSTNQIVDYNPGKKVYTPSDPSSVIAKNPLRRAKAQELIGHISPEHETQWKSDYQVHSPVRETVPFFKHDPHCLVK